MTLLPFIQIITSSVLCIWQDTFIPYLQDIVPLSHCIHRALASLSWAYIKVLLWKELKLSISSKKYQGRSAQLFCLPTDVIIICAHYPLQPI